MFGASTIVLSELYRGNKPIASGFDPEAVHASSGRDPLALVVPPGNATGC
jgi:hypothetical protein